MDEHDRMEEEEEYEGIGSTERLAKSNLTAFQTVLILECSAPPVNRQFLSTRQLLEEK